MKDLMKSVTKIQYPGYRPWFGDKRDKRNAIHSARQYLKNQLRKCLTNDC